MKITVEGCRPMASEIFWPSIEEAIGALTGETDGVLTRISRPDGKCNYRDYGTYELTYSAPWFEHQVTLELK
jgi:hypothetical protein